MMGMLTHPHAKPEKVTVKDCTHILSQLRTVKEAAEVERIKAAATVAVAGMTAAIAAVTPGLTESVDTDGPVVLTSYPRRLERQ